MRYIVGECTLADLRAIVPRLRALDCLEAASARIAPRHLLHRLWGESIMRRSAHVDGAIAAVWGCTGTLCGSDGNPWLFTTQAIEHIPLAFFREARREIAGMLETKAFLETGVLREYDRSVRFWKMIGFGVVGEYELGNRAFLKLRMERA